MRFGLVILVVLLIGLANARPRSSERSQQLRRLIKAYERRFANRGEPSFADSNGLMWSFVPASSNTPPTTSYKVLPTETNLATIGSQLGDLGWEGYADAGAVSDSSYQRANVFIKFNSKDAKYDYQLRPAVTTIEDFISILNAHGSTGYRILVTKYTTSGSYLVFVRNSNRQEARYQCHAQTKPSNPNDLFQQIKSQGADGYRYYGYGPQNSILYCKDTSVSLTLEYVTTPFANYSADFEQQANELGAKGYRYSNIVFFAPPFVPGLPYKMSYIPLYYKDSSHPDVTYNYKIMKEPNGLKDFPNQLNEQGQNGFLYLGAPQFYNEEFKVQVYMDLNVCKCADYETDYYY